MQQYQPAFKDEGQKLQAFVPLIEQLIAQGKYCILGVQDGVVLLQKGITSTPQATRDWLNLHSEITPMPMPVLSSPH